VKADRGYGRHKPAKEFDDGEGGRKFKRNMHIAVDVMELADKADQIVVFSGDGDFRSLVEAIQRRSVHVTVVSSNASQPPMDCRRVAAASGCLYRFG
jgi:uncharacterized LabA/DUF88 family protein